MDSRTIRKTFLDFFVEKDHLLISGSSVIPKNDPTLLYVNSGMAPLKAYFVGAEKPPATDLVNIQPCIRTNDIDDVGDRHHLTFFEMLGSWSIGGYFKEHAIELAFELLVDRFKLPVERLYTTVFNGEGSSGVGFDEVSAAAWERVGINRDHIVALPAEDNWWGPAGITGPCGPCTEVFLDTGAEFGDAYVPGGEFDTQGRYIEIWNAGVFMEFDKQADGHLEPLPFTSVDTGSGLERMVLAMNGLRDVYEGDGLAPIVQAVVATVGGNEIEHHHRVIADHMRSSVMILSSGVEPSNEGRGYIPRRLLRKSFSKALEHGYESLDLAPVVEVIVDQLGDSYPYIAANASGVLDLINREAHDFESALKRGRDQLRQLAKRKDELTGRDVFNLFATYGLPIDIAKDLASQMGISVSDAEIDEAAELHRAASAGGTLGSEGGSDMDAILGEVAQLPVTKFLGYETTNAVSPISALYRDGRPVDVVSTGETAYLLTDETPFYPVGGGQVADIGTVTSADHTAHGNIVDTQKVDSGQILHKVEVVAGDLAVGTDVELAVADERRRSIKANHSATHLLNAALRNVLGEHITQAGSLVEAERLRFDFTHPKPVSKDELLEIERIVNGWILDDAPAVVRELPYADAIASGARSLDTEKYGDDVRVVGFGEFSTELCGGTHVSRTSEIGLFRFTTEESVAAGTRRVNAVTRGEAVDRMLRESVALREVSRMLSSSPERAVEALEQRLKAAATPKAAAADQEVVDVRDVSVNGQTIKLGKLIGSTKEMKAEAEKLAKAETAVAVVWLAAKGRVSVAAASPDDRASAKVVIKGLMDATGGGGGGGPRSAQGGFEHTGDDDPADRIAEALTGLSALS